MKPYSLPSLDPHDAALICVAMLVHTRAKVSSAQSELSGKHCSKLYEMTA